MISKGLKNNTNENEEPFFKNRFIPEEEKHFLYLFWMLEYVFQKVAWDSCLALDSYGK